MASSPDNLHFTDATGNTVNKTSTNLKNYIAKSSNVKPGRPNGPLNKALELYGKFLKDPLYIYKRVIYQEDDYSPIRRFCVIEKICPDTDVRYSDNVVVKETAVFSVGQSDFVTIFNLDYPDEKPSNEIIDFFSEYANVGHSKSFIQFYGHHIELDSDGEKIYHNIDNCFYTGEFIICCKNTGGIRFCGSTVNGKLHGKLITYDLMANEENVEIYDMGELVN